MVGGGLRGYFPKGCPHERSTRTRPRGQPSLNLYVCPEVERNEREWIGGLGHHAFKGVPLGQAVNTSVLHPGAGHMNHMQDAGCPHLY